LLIVGDYCWGSRLSSNFFLLWNVLLGFVLIHDTFVEMELLRAVGRQKFLICCQITLQNDGATWKTLSRISKSMIWTLCAVMFLKQRAWQCGQCSAATVSNRKKGTPAPRNHKLEQSSTDTRNSGRNAGADSNV
jgi:hypothetical protein